MEGEDTTRAALAPPSDGTDSIFATYATSWTLPTDSSGLEWNGAAGFGSVAPFEPPSGASALATRRDWNASLPVSRLPPEILQEILLFAQRDPYVPLWISWRESKLRALATVSRHWMFAIVCNPAFWPILDFDHNDRLGRLIRQRNPSGPLMVRCSAREHSVASVDDVKNFWQSIEHPKRVWSVVLSGEQPIVFHSAAPFLPFAKDIQIHYDYRSPQSEEIELEGHVQLLHLMLSGLDIRWDSPRLTCLQSLHLSALHTVPSIPQLHSVLSTSPSLEVLLLRDIHDNGIPDNMASGTIGVHADPYEHPSIHLPHLSALILHAIPTPIIDFVLSSIVSPGCSSTLCSPLSSHHLNPNSRLRAIVAECIKKLPRSVAYTLRFDEGLEGLEGLESLEGPTVAFENYERHEDLYLDVPDYRESVRRYPGTTLVFPFDPFTESDALVAWLSSLTDHFLTVAFSGARYVAGEVKPLPSPFHCDNFTKAFTQTNWPIEEMEFRDGFFPETVLMSPDRFAKLFSLKITPLETLPVSIMEQSFGIMLMTVETFVKTRNRTASTTDTLANQKHLRTQHLR